MMTGQGLNEQQECTIYVRNLDERVDDKLLEELFTQVGPVLSVTIRGGHPKPAVTANNETEPAKKPTAGTGNRFAFIEFEDVESVLFACEIMDAIEIYGQKLKVQPRDNTNQKAIYLQLGMPEKSYERHRGTKSTGRQPERHSDGGASGGSYSDRPVPVQQVPIQMPWSAQPNFAVPPPPLAFLPVISQQLIPPPPPAFNNASMRRHNSDTQLHQQLPAASSSGWVPPPTAPNFYQTRVDSVVHRVQQDGRYRQNNNYQQHRNPKSVSDGAGGFRGGGGQRTPPSYTSYSRNATNGYPNQYHQNQHHRGNYYSGGNGRR